MTQVVKISEFLPNGIVTVLPPFFEEEVPGALCVMIVPGLTPPPPPQKRVAVISGNRKEYEQYLRENGLKDRRDAMYCSDRWRCHGLNGKVVLTGSYKSRRDWPGFEDDLRSNTHADVWVSVLGPNPGGA